MLFTSCDHWLKSRDTERTTSQYFSVYQYFTVYWLQGLNKTQHACMNCEIDTDKGIRHETFLSVQFISHAGSYSVWDTKDTRACKFCVYDSSFILASDFADIMHVKWLCFFHKHLFTQTQALYIVYAQPSKSVRDISFTDLLTQRWPLSLKLDKDRTRHSLHAHTHNQDTGFASVQISECSIKDTEKIQPSF